MRVVKAEIKRTITEIRDMVILENGKIDDLAEHLDYCVYGFIVPENMSVDSYEEHYGEPELINIIEEKGCI